MPCRICRRDTGPNPVVPDWLLPVREDAERVCSIKCLAILSMKDDKMTDPTELEVTAIEYAGDTSGEYLDSIGKTDLASLSRDEYMTFVECIVTNFVDKLRELENAQLAS